MDINCLGAVTVEPAQYEELIIKLRELGDNESRKKLPSVLTYFHLGGKRYVPLTQKAEVERENRCEAALQSSKKKPIPIGEIIEPRTAATEPTVNSAMIDRLWLYDGKLYQTLRNDYSQEQVYLLIMDFIEKEASKFKKLQQRFKKT